MKIVFLDAKTIGDDIDMSGFDALGDVVRYNFSTPEESLERTKDADVVIINKVEINEKTIGNADHLKLVCVTATGTNNLDKEYLAKRGIEWRNVAGYSTETVAQHTFALLLYLVEKMRFFDDYVKNGTYSRSNCFSCLDMIYPEIAGKTWGIIGMGAIGQKVAQIATVFGCKVICYSASGRTYDMPYEQVDFDTLLAKSDILSVHAPLNEYTKGLMNYDAFCKMKSSAYFINVGRGPIVVEEDLARALEEDQIRAAGLDVLCVEPMPLDNPLLKFKDSSKIIITPHVAWATSEARQRCVDVVTENIKAFLRGEEKNVVKG